MRQESKLIRNLGFWDLMGLAIGQIIGAGIMSSTGVAIGMTGTGVALAFLLSPILTLIAIMPIAILGSAVPATGGRYRYVSRLMGKNSGMLYLLLHVTMNVMIATYALSFASYFVSIVSGVNERLVAMIVLTLFFIANLIGTKSAAIINKVMDFALVGGLLLFIGFGLGKADVAYVFNPANMFEKGGVAFLATLALLYSSTSGAQCIAELGGEAKNPEKDIPRVLVLSTVFVGVFYVLISIVAAGVLPISEVANQPLSLVARATMPKAAFYLFVIGAALGATATTLNSTMTHITKPLLVACDDGLLPSSFGVVSKNGVPWKILTFFYVIGMIPLVSGFSLSFIAKFTTANSLLCQLLICASLFMLVKNRPELLKKSSMKITPKSAMIIALTGGAVLCVLSYSLLLNLSVKVIAFLAVLILIVLVYSKTAIKDVVIPDDLTVDYTSNEQN